MRGNQESAHTPTPTMMKTVKYEKPKLLLVDIPDVQSALIAEGYSVESGSLGAPYKVAKNDDLTPVITNYDLPEHTEHEIIIADLMTPKVLDSVAGEKQTSDGTNDWWVSSSRGIVDPRARAAAIVQSDFDNILAHGGVFIIFAGPRYTQAIKYGHVSYGVFRTEASLDYDNWSFLSVFDHLGVTTTTGHEISVHPMQIPLTDLLTSHLNGGKYLTTLQPIGSLSSAWLELAANKYSDAVSGVLIPSNESDKGYVFIFPQISNKGGFLIRFIGEVLPEYTPHLFPHLEGGRWVHRPEYELPKISELKARIEQIEEETRRRLTELDTEIEKERTASKYLYDLLRETGTPLVCATKKALEELGFEKVIDVDEEKQNTGDKTQLREDLQIRDKTPLIVTEVKGINNLPKENYSLQVWKYIAPTMKKLGRVDVRGLAIINHQRNLPPLDRENDRTFSEDILTNAEMQDFGLLTTWDLFRLVRSFKTNRWKHEQVAPLFYQNGRISPIPIHYEYIGKIDHFWENVGVLSIQVENAEIKKGDRIGFELSVEFVEQSVESLEMDNHAVERAEIGQRVAIKTQLNKREARAGVRVFRVVI